MAGALALTATLAACSTNSPSGSMTGMDHGTSGTATTDTSITNTGPHNDADVTFAMDMIPHHQQAVEMADMILAKDGIDADVIDLATRIKAAQDPEIITMTSWLSIWGEMMNSSDMSDMRTMGENGMMSSDDMNALDKATGDEATRLFLEGMTTHHKGAITMAQTEISDGENPDAIELAKTIVEDQTAEIDEMSSLLRSL
ncbi:DUF305 domain-containing protein [Naasia lichenicola]|uniref:DUF305 domain-containing protein n=1 Tax=Naasia lichenicola TaxID=2565933 RepID=UPI001E330776|nr:DUF305 domain-containing protein [Naasia lichenicola]